MTFVLLLMLLSPIHWTPDSLSSPAYEAAPVFSPDGREMFFFRGDAGFRHYRLAWARCEDEGWREQPPLPFFAKPPVDDSDPMISADGNRLYFITTRTEAGAVKDDFDIWAAERRPGGGWSDAQPLPAPVNSPGSELLPRLSTTGGLIFGSDRAGGSGGMDIYFADKGPDGRWSVRNAGPDINTEANEYEAAMATETGRLVLVSDRDGRSHLYLFDRRGDAWHPRGQVPALEQVFQVGPSLSPKGSKLLFAQADGTRSGEIFLIDLDPGEPEAWPPACR